MKQLICVLFTFSILFSACSTKKENKLELFSLQAVSFNMGSENEVNIEGQIKGFSTQQNGEKYNANVNIVVDLIKPSGEKVNQIYKQSIDTTFNEEVSDFGLEMQMLLDSTYQKGEYIAKVLAVDNKTKVKTESEVKFTLD